MEKLNAPSTTNTTLIPNWLYQTCNFTLSHGRCCFGFSTSHISKEVKNKKKPQDKKVVLTNSAEVFFMLTIDRDMHS